MADSVLNTNIVVLSTSARSFGDAAASLALAANALSRAAQSMSDAAEYIDFAPFASRAFIEDKGDSELQPQPQTQVQVPVPVPSSPGYETNNKRTVPSTPDNSSRVNVRSPQPAPAAAPVGFGPGFNLEARPFDIRNIVAGYPPLPQGHHYIQLNNELGEIAVTAYMALQNRKTICVVLQRTMLSSYAKVLEAVTKAAVFYPKDEGRFDSVEMGLVAFRQATFPAMLLLSHDMLHSVLFQAAAPDCVIHWGLPRDIPNYVSQVSRLAQDKRSCLLLPHGHEFDMFKMQQLREYGVVQYFEPVLVGYFGPRSPFPMVRRIANQVLVASGVQVGPPPGESSSRAVLSAPKPELPRSSAQAGLPPTELSLLVPPCPLPAGHYYLVLNEPLDMIPLMAYLALRGTRTVCYLPENTVWNAYQQLFHRITGLTTVPCSENSTVIARNAIGLFKSKETAILLRPANDNWHVCLGGGQGDCLVYMGVPENIPKFHKRCSTTVTHSYMLLSPLEYIQLLTRMPREVLAHPSAGILNDDKPSSVLHNLRAKTGAMLADMKNPPILVSKYQALLSRRDSLAIVGANAGQF